MTCQNILYFATDVVIPRSVSLLLALLYSSMDKGLPEIWFWNSSMNTRNKFSDALDTGVRYWWAFWASGPGNLRLATPLNTDAVASPRSGSRGLSCPLTCRLPSYLGFFSNPDAEATGSLDLFSLNMDHSSRLTNLIFSMLHLQFCCNPDI